MNWLQVIGEITLFLILFGKTLCTSSQQQRDLINDLPDFEHYFENVRLFYNKSFDHLTTLLSSPQLPERYWRGFIQQPSDMVDNDSVLKFSWSNCGSTKDPVIFKSLKVSDPIHFPGYTTLGFDIKTLVNITSIQMNLKIQKKVFFLWITVPCRHNVGSCFYPDVCSLMPSPCPKPIIERKLPCHCPVPKGVYLLPPTSFYVPPISIPSWLTRGDYKITADAQQHGSRLFCLELRISCGK
ncbi:ganglioside GM2 activator-like [Tachypleus tridentatus]|uniref:ganglioside GM2 activator-like n=1 Tax=Tachypleus tridentatus TaxID=6853 RepID=UPI003FD5D4A1